MPVLFLVCWCACLFVCLLVARVLCLSAYWSLTCVGLFVWLLVRSCVWLLVSVSDVVLACVLAWLCMSLFACVFDALFVCLLVSLCLLVCVFVCFVGWSRVCVRLLVWLFVRLIDGCYFVCFRVLV